MRNVIFTAARDLFPGYFALVMATGIVSIACELLGLHWVAVPLVVVSWLGYIVLWALTLLRIIRYRRQLFDDLIDHQRSPGFFTVVAATCVLGAQSLVIDDLGGVAAALWVFGLGLWCAVMYGFFTAIIVHARETTLAKGINGAWLNAVVATQSVVVLKGVLDASSTPSTAVQFLCLVFFMVGCMLYLAFIPLIFYRLVFARMDYSDFAPSYWINMGAVAITTLAGSILILQGGSWPVLAQFMPFLTGFTLFFWAVATWWIPLLVALAAWRYIWREERVKYEPQLWSMVFPLGMYTVGTDFLSRALHLPFLTRISDAFVYIALAAWTAVFVGLVHRLMTRARAASRR